MDLQSLSRITINSYRLLYTVNGYLCVCVCVCVCVRARVCMRACAACTYYLSEFYGN